jgi:hypothetical protein
VDVIRGQWGRPIQIRAPRASPHCGLPTPTGAARLAPRRSSRRWPVLGGWCADRDADLFTAPGQVAGPVPPVLEGVEAIKATGEIPGKRMFGKRVGRVRWLPGHRGLALDVGDSLGDGPGAACGPRSDDLQHGPEAVWPIPARHLRPNHAVREARRRRGWDSNPRTSIRPLPVSRPVAPVAHVSRMLARKCCPHTDWPGEGNGRTPLRPSCVQTSASMGCRHAAAHRWSRP